MSLFTATNDTLLAKDHLAIIAGSKEDECRKESRYAFVYTERGTSYPNAKTYACELNGSGTCAESPNVTNSLLLPFRKSSKQVTAYAELRKRTRAVPCLGFVL